MKQINGITSSALMNVQSTRTGRNSSATASKTFPAKQTSLSGANTARLSTGSLLLQQNAGTDDVRSEKIAQLKASIHAGTYSVSTSAVADQLLGSMLA